MLGVGGGGEFVEKLLRKGNDLKHVAKQEGRIEAARSLEVVVLVDVVVAAAFVVVDRRSWRKYDGVVVVVWRSLSTITVCIITITTVVACIIVVHATLEGVVTEMIVTIDLRGIGVG